MSEEKKPKPIIGIVVIDPDIDNDVVDVELENPERAVNYQEIINALEEKIISIMTTEKEEQQLHIAKTVVPSYIT